MHGLEISLTFSNESLTVVNFKLHYLFLQTYEWQQYSIRGSGPCFLANRLASVLPTPQLKPNCQGVQLQLAKPPNQWHHYTLWGMLLEPTTVFWQRQGKWNGALLPALPNRVEDSHVRPNPANKCKAKNPAYSISPIDTSITQDAPAFNHMKVHMGTRLCA